MRVLVTNAHRNVGFLVTRHLAAAGHEVIASDSRALPFTRHPVGNPYRLSDPAALAGKVLLQVAEACERRRPAAGRRGP
jgi:nucleoside-diphosphate-sugar epimerase